MSQQSWHQAFCHRVTGPWDRASLLAGSVQDVLAHLPVRALWLRAGPSEDYGTLEGEPTERLVLAGDRELWVTLTDSPGTAEKTELLELLRAHFEACLSLAGRLTLAAEEVARSRKVLEESHLQVVHNSKMAAVGQLAAGVAHELNSPLGAVMLQLDAAQLNLERERYEKAADKLSSAAKAAASAKEIISKLLFYSRDATKGKRSVNLNDVVDDTLALLGKQLCYENLELKVHLGQIPNVQANQNELQQVVTNLLLNAKDAVLEPEARGNSVEVRTYTREGSVCLEVRDGGPGISEQAMGKIFQPFFTTKPVGKGTGLGLSVSSKIVEQHGGTLTAENQPGGGARFQMALPRAGPDQPERKIGSGREASPSPNTPRGDDRADGRHTIA